MSGVVKWTDGCSTYANTAYAHTTDVAPHVPTPGSGDAARVLTVNANETGTPPFSWVEPASGGDTYSIGATIGSGDVELTLTADAGTDSTVAFYPGSGISLAVDPVDTITITNDAPFPGFGSTSADAAPGDHGHALFAGEGLGGSFDIGDMIFSDDTNKLNTLSRPSSSYTGCVLKLTSAGIPAWETPGYVCTIFGGATGPTVKGAAVPVGNNSGSKIGLTLHNDLTSSGDIVNGQVWYCPALWVQSTYVALDFLITDNSHTSTSTPHARISAMAGTSPVISSNTEIKKSTGDLVFWTGFGASDSSTTLYPNLVLYGNPVYAEFAGSVISCVNLTVGEDLTVGGDSTLAGTLDVTGDISASNLVFPLQVSQGGTGFGTGNLYTAGDMLYADTTNSLAQISQGIADQVLTLVDVEGTPVPQWIDSNYLPIESVNLANDGGVISNCCIILKHTGNGAKNMLTLHNDQGTSGTLVTTGPTVEYTSLDFRMDDQDTQTSAGVPLFTYPQARIKVTPAQSAYVPAGTVTVEQNRKSSGDMYFDVAWSDDGGAVGSSDGLYTAMAIYGNPQFVQITGSLAVNLGINVGGQNFNVGSNGNVLTKGQLKLDTKEIRALGTDSSGVSVAAVGHITTSSNITAVGSITANGSITSSTGNINAQVDVTANRYVYDSAGNSTQWNSAYTKATAAYNAVYAAVNPNYVFTVYGGSRVWTHPNNHAPHLPFAGGTVAITSGVNGSGATTQGYVLTIDSSGVGAYWGSAASHGSHSDSRFKENVVDLKESYSSALDIVKQLKPKKFNFTDAYKSNLNSSEEHDSTNEIGFLYEDVKEIIPEVTYKAMREKWWETGETEDYKSESYGNINYPVLVPLLVQALQELGDKVEILEKKLQDKEED